MRRIAILQHESWCRDAADELAQAGGPGVQHAEEMLRDLPTRVAELHQVSRTVYANWVRSIPRPLQIASKWA